MEETTRRPPIARIANPEGGPPLMPPPPEVMEEARANGAKGSDDEALERIFAAGNLRNRAEEEIHVKSLGMNITIRELTQRELDDVFEMFEDRANPRARGRKRRLSEINAHLVAKAIVRPDFHSEKARELLMQTYGTPVLSEVLPRLFKPLEVTALAERVLALSGGDDDAVSSAENL
jgi:hypothetical protein